MSDQEGKNPGEAEKKQTRSPEIEIDVHDEKEILNRKTPRERSEEEKK